VILMLFGVFYASYWAAFALLLERRKDEWPKWQMWSVVGSLACALSSTDLSIANAAGKVVRVRYDEYVMAFDRILGSPSFTLGKMLVAYRWMYSVCVIVYDHLNLACGIVVVLYLWREPIEDCLELVRTIVAVSALALPLYLIFPVSGPLFAYRRFPFELPSAQPHLIYLTYAPDGVPSVHMTLALLICWYARTWRIGRILSVIYATLTVVATLGSGQHYLFDLMAAVPFTALVLYLSQNKGGTFRLFHCRPSS
jgi:hypothetical protein